MDKHSKEKVYTYAMMLAFDLTINIFLYCLGYNLYVLYHMEMKEKMEELYKSVRIVIDVCLLWVKMLAIALYKLMWSHYENSDQLLMQGMYSVKKMMSATMSFVNTMYALKMCYFNLWKACVSYYVSAYYFLIFSAMKTAMSTAVFYGSMLWTCVVNFYHALIHLWLVFVSMCMMVIHLSAFLYASYLTVTILYHNRRFIFSLAIFFLCVCGVLYLDLINR